MLKNAMMVERTIGVPGCDGVTCNENTKLVAFLSNDQRPDALHAQ